ncbi:hypothetical protein [Bacillus sp. FJAT-29937]|uniref:hypothetical protein n=1 Tax=Bacillus sp. FJAT-29937 TaxID=1720553 RepID=UPI000832C3CA|nr:hypothetical protein [Bacillus sp. FJAT-29937]
MGKFFKENKWVIPISVLLVLIPWGINLFFKYGDLETGKNLSNVEWLAFWGSYLGGAATLTAVCLTLSQNMKVIKQNEKIIIQNQENLNFQEERSRIALMPYIEVRIFIDEELKLHKAKLQPPNGFITLSHNQDSKIISSDLPKKYHQIIDLGMIKEINDDRVTISRSSNINFVRLIMTQKAPSLARNIEISVTTEGEQDETKKYLTPPFLLACGESVTLPILFDENLPRGVYKFNVSFEDIEGRIYEQFFSIQHKGSDGYRFTPINNPKLRNRINS